MHAKDLIWWADFRLQDVEKQRERRKTKAKKKAERRKKKRLGNMKTPTFLWGFFLADFNYRTGEKSRFLTKMCPPVGVSPIHIYIYMCVCAVELETGPRFCVKIWSKSCVENWSNCSLLSPFL